MRLRDVYMKKNFKYQPKSFFDNKEGKRGGWDPINWNFAYLNGVHIPSTNQIVAAQKTMGLAHVMTTFNQHILNQINKDFFGPYTFDPTITQELISNIEKALETSGNKNDSHYALGWLKPEQNSTEKQLINRLKNNQTKFGNTLLMLKQIYGAFQLNQQNSLIPFPKKVVTQLQNLNNVIEQLETDLQAIKTQVPQIDISSRLSKTTGSMGYLQRTQNIGYELKGFLLPLMGINYYNQFLEQTGRYFIETGAWTNNKGQEIPVDIMGISNLSINFSGSINGEKYQGPLSGIIEAMEKAAQSKQSISIKVDDWDSFLADLKKNNSYLIQSKAGKNTPVLNNKFSITLDDIVSNRKSKESNALARLQSLKRYYSARIYASHEQYEALFSYELSKYMDSIIGVENNIVLTPMGFQTLDMWIKKEFVNKYYRPKYLSLNSNKNIPIVLK